MRFVLRILLAVLIVLLRLEDTLRFTLTNWKKASRLFHKKSEQIFIHLSKSLLYSLKLIKKAFQVRKRKTIRKTKTIIKAKTIFKAKRKTLSAAPLKIKLQYILFGVIVSTTFIFAPTLFFIFLQDMPSPKELTLRQIPQTTKIFDRNGTLLTQIYAQQNRTVIPLSQIPMHMQLATIAIEDKNFYNHMGFDIPSIIRAIKINFSGGSLQGGSTITQQLIKSSILTPEKSITRKIKELILAFWAERIYTKKQILEMYFNQVPYGGTAWGIEAASQAYFGQQTSSLNLAQSAFLAGLTAAPTIYSPYGNNPDLWKNRQKEVLSRMVYLGYISNKEALTAENEPLNFNKQQTAIHAPHFVAYVKEHLAEKYGLPMLEKGGLIITTTLDLGIQEMTEKIVYDEIEASSHLNITNGAALVTDPRNGDILAMVGSKDWNEPQSGNFNVSTSLRQPGSAIKAITYAAALQQGLTAATFIEDSPVTYANYSTPYSPVNYSGKFHGKVTLRSSLANSLNIPAVKTLNHIGIPAMVNLGKKMGIKSWSEPENYGLSITLGAAEVTMLEMATIYGTFANSGDRVNLNPVSKITDTSDRVLEQKTEIPKIRVLEKGIAFIITDILADNQVRAMEFGANSPLNIPGHTVSVKTGTTDNKRDNWTAGYTNNFVTVVWVGNNNNSPMSPYLTSGISGAAPIWHKVMLNLLTGSPESKPTPPSEITQKVCRGKIEYFLHEQQIPPECRSLDSVNIKLPDTKPSL